MVRSTGVDLLPVYAADSGGKKTTGRKATRGAAVKKKPGRKGKK